MFEFYIYGFLICFALLVFVMLFFYNDPLIDLKIIFYDFLSILIMSCLWPILLWGILTFIFVNIFLNLE